MSKKGGESIYSILKHMDATEILYHRGILTAGEYNARVLESINRARQALGMELLTGLPAGIGKP